MLFKHWGLFEISWQINLIVIKKKFLKNYCRLEIKDLIHQGVYFIQTTQDFFKEKSQYRPCPFPFLEQQQKIYTFPDNLHFKKSLGIKEESSLFRVWSFNFFCFVLCLIWGRHLLVKITTTNRTLSKIKNFYKLQGIIIKKVRNNPESGRNINICKPCI